MAQVGSGSYGHAARWMAVDWWEISWTVDTKYGRMRYPRLYRRVTSNAGAIRFAKKWGLELKDGRSQVKRP